MALQPLPPSRCPCVAALLRTLAEQGEASVAQGNRNAENFVKCKTERKCALIVNMIMFYWGVQIQSMPLSASLP